MRQTLDIELNARDIQAIGSNDAVAAFFARLGYNTDVRTPQTPGNLGITNDSIVRPINGIELIADQEGLFQVYLIELTSVTITHTRNLARVFRNRSGNYLLVLTSDYDRLDFVLLEKYLPPSKGDGSIVQRQVSIRPRVITVERRNPGRAHLRVLRRFTWTESDPFAQYDKLLSAYAVADWTEEFFNNRALFSDYYLLERVPSTAEWKADPKPCYRQLQGLYQGGISKFAGKGEELLRRELLEPALEALGFSYKTGKKSGDSAVEPDYRLYAATDRGLLALCLVYPWGRLLDGKDYERDNETPDENPGAIVVSLLEKGEAAWVVVTNGKFWRLYSQRSHSRATNYYEIDLEETLVQADSQILDLATAFRYFWLLFRAQAFVPVEVEREGCRQQLSFLDQLLLESEDYARELGERLKERVFEEVFPHLAEGFIVHIQQDRKADLSQEALDEIFQGTLTFLYRLLFLLYAEARNLLPVKEVRGYYEASLTRLKGEVAEAAGRIAEGVGENFKKRFHLDESVREYHRAADALAPFKRILDLYTSQWFGKGGQQQAKAASPALDFLKRQEAESFLNAADEKGLDKALGKLHRDDHRIAETALQAARQKRFFHWELEFPEVFYRPRPGTERVVERLEGAGFDAVIGNPPYDVLASEELGYDVSQELVFFESAPVYEPAIRGKKNLYKLFVCRGADVLGKEGAFSFIVPMPLLGDDQAAGVRRMLLERTGLAAIEAFPQKDDSHNRVFPEAKLATTLFVTRAQPAKARIAVRTHPGRLIEEESSTLQVLPEEVIRFDPENAAIPSCTQRDWEIAVAIIGHEKTKRLGECCRASQGEVNETTDGKKGYISKNPKDGPQILRGSTICLYTLREASQGEAIYLRKKKYLEGKPDSEKAHHHEQRRVGWQESSPQNNFRRIIATAIPEGEFCNHLINYIPEKDSQLSLDFVLALLNSRVSDWFFRLGSTNAHVSHYQIYNLPAPTFSENNPPLNWKPLLEKGHWPELAALLCSSCTEPGVMPQPVAEALAGMSRRIQEIEAKRVLKSRSERSRLDPASQPIQDAVDRVLFQCYGLSEEEARYIEQRLGEML